jgi:hypothetical protein
MAMVLLDELLQLYDESSFLPMSEGMQQSDAVPSHREKITLGKLVE